MRLESVSIKRYRSAQNVELNKVGDLNVLIGKNNAGKSTLLTAMRAFFLCLQGGNVVTLDPPIGSKAIDFSRRDTSQPIEISLQFSLSSSERGAVLEDLVSEAPQLKNAIENLDLSLLLFVSIQIMPPPNSFSYVRKLSLLPATQPPAPHPERTLLSVEGPSASDLASKYRKIRDISVDLEALKKFLSGLDEDDFRQIKRDSPEGRSMGRFLLTRRISDLKPSTVELVEGLIRESTSYADLQSTGRAMAERLNEKLTATQVEPLSNSVETFSGLQATVPQYALNALRDIAKMPVLYLTEQRRPVGKEEAERLLQLKTQRGGDKTLENIKQTVHSLLGVKIDAFASSSTAPQGRGAEMDVDDFLLEVNGSGIREALRLILDVEFLRPSLLFVEEPEVHLHPALETSMMRFLKGISQNCQIFISTHSTNFLDTGEMKNVYLISKVRDATEVQSLSLEDAEATLPKELGVRLSSLFMFDRLVFVEGPSDEAIVREWAATLGENLSQSNVGFINIGGVRNFTHYATESIFGFLTKRQVECWFILDRDERRDQEIEGLKTRLGDKARVLILEKREIENFLLSSSAIERFIRVKQTLSANKQLPEPTQQAVVAAMNECAESLKQRVIDKRVARILCGSVHPQIDWNLEPGARSGNHGSC